MTFKLFTCGKVLHSPCVRPDAAILTCGDTILAVGDRRKLKDRAPSGTEGIDLGPGLAVPGFVDCHVHLLGLGLRLIGDRLDLTSARSLAETLAVVREHASRLPAGEPIRGGGWDANVWPEGRRPTAADLDAAAPGRVVILTSKCGHSVWVSRQVLDEIGITTETPDPPGGRIGRDAEGQPDGVLYEAAMEPVWALRPEVSVFRRKEALLAAQRHAHSLGIVGCHNCEGPETLGPLLELQNESLLRLRVTHHVPEDLVGQAAELAVGSRFGGKWLRVGSLKVFADGSLGARTAAMLEPYRGTTDTGLLEHNARSIAELGRKAAEARLGLAVHAIGDRAVHETLNGIQVLVGDGLAPSIPHRIEHAQHVHEDDLPRLARLGVIASVQPVHLRGDYAMVTAHLPDREGRAFAYGSMLRAGAVLCFGSDAPVETMDPLEGLRAAVTRRDWDEKPTEGWRPQEKLSVADALAAYTLAAATASGTADVEGIMAPGYRADFVVLSHDIITEPDALAECYVKATVVGGDVVCTSPAGRSRR